MNRLSIYFAAAVILLTSACHGDDSHYRLRQELNELTEDAPCRTGIAVIFDNGDTLTVNNSSDYPLMSVFKLHEAVAAGRVLDEAGAGLGETVAIDSCELKTNTWSPMLKDYPAGDLTLQAGTLLDYMLVYSDNNASNIVFDHIVSIAETDSIVRSLNICDDFYLRHTESEMQANNALAYENTGSPLSCASLIKALATDSLMSAGIQNAIACMTADCVSAPDRIRKGLVRLGGARIFNRTGSGYVNENGKIVAVNDVAYVTMPDGRGFALAVLIRDYAGKQADASALIARIAEKVSEYLYPASE